MFIDTTSLFKKYVDEKGADTFDALLKSVFEIIISPITLLEINSIIERRLREKTLNASDANWIEKEFMFDLNFYGVVEFNEKLISECIRVIRKHQLKVLDLHSTVFSHYRETGCFYHIRQTPIQIRR